MIVRWFTTAAIQMENQQGQMLFDPFIPLKRAEHAVELSAYDGATYIFVTHGHFDHISAIPSIQKRNPAVQIFCTKTPRNTLLHRGVPEENLHEIHYGDVISLHGCRIYVLPGKHAVLPGVSWRRLRHLLSSSAIGNVVKIVRENRCCREKDETVIYRIEWGGKCITLLGSMNLREGVEYPQNSELLILPYNGWEDNFAHAQEILSKLKPKAVLLDHFDDSFPPITMPIDVVPLQEAYPTQIKTISPQKESYIV